MYAHGHLEGQEIVGPHLHVSGCQGANSMCLSVGGPKETRFRTVAAAYERDEWELSEHKGLPICTVNLVHMTFTNTNCWEQGLSIQVVSHFPEFL